jgi:hypothetical protein
MLFRHCVVVTDGFLIQAGLDRVRVFRVNRRAIERLRAAGWVFVAADACGGGGGIFLTCVGFAKRAAGIRAPFVWTPDQLFRFLVKSSQ